MLFQKCQKKFKNNRRGFTLIELLSVVAIIGMAGALMYMAFLHNWLAMDNFVTEANLWQEMDEIVNEVTLTGRPAQEFVVTADTNEQRVDMLDEGVAYTTLTMNNNREFFIDRDGAGAGLNEIMSRSLDFDNSSFALDGKSLVINLVLSNQIFTNKEVNIETTTEIYPRNSNN